MRLHVPKRTFCDQFIQPIWHRFTPIDLPFKMYNYYGAGKPTLLIFHGLYGNKNNWNSVAKQLNKRSGNTVICSDLRNHGESPWVGNMTFEHMAADIELLADEEEVNLIGHSLGGKAVAAFALMRPDLVNKCIIEDVCPRPYGSEHRRAEIPKYLDAMLSLDWSQHPECATLNSARKYAEQVLLPLVPDPVIRSFLLTNVVENEHKNGGAWALNLKGIKDDIMTLWDFPDFSDRICDKPTLIMKGAKSDYLRPGDMEKFILPRFPNAHLEEISGGHWIHAENPAGFIQSVLEFLREKVWIRNDMFYSSRQS